MTNSIIKDIVIDKVPLVRQSEAGNNYWKTRACGVAVVKMLISFKDPALREKTLDELISKGIESRAYIKNLGWKHQGLVDLAEAYGVSLQFQKQFFNTPEKKEEGLGIIDGELKRGRPVAISVHPGFNSQKDSHLLLIIGKHEGREVGYFIQDPYYGIRGHNYFVGIKELMGGWRGGMIWFK